MKTVRLQDLAKRLDARKAELGITGDAYVALNRGMRRTPSKHALLRAIHEAAEKRGRKPPFAP